MTTESAKSEQPSGLSCARRPAIWGVVVLATLLGAGVTSWSVGRIEAPVAEVAEVEFGATRLLEQQARMSATRQQRAQQLLDRLYPGQALVTVHVELEPSLSRESERIASDWPSVRSETRVSERGSGGDGSRHDTRTSEFEPFVGTREKTWLAPEIRAVQAVLVLDPVLGDDLRRRREITDAVSGAVGSSKNGPAEIKVLVEPLASIAVVAEERSQSPALAAAWPWLGALGAAALAFWLGARRGRRDGEIEPTDEEQEMAPQGAIPSGTESSEEQAEPAPESTDEVAPGPFTRFAAYEAQDLAAVLGDGHPQLAAVLLAHLDPAMAADILHELSAETRSEVVRRIANLDRVTSDAVARVSKVLDQEIARRELRPGHSATPRGAESAAAIVNQLGDIDLLRDIEARDEEAAERIRQKMFSFDDLARLDGRSMQRVLASVDAQLVAMALKSSSPQVEAHVFANLSRRAGALITDEREALGPTPRREVLAAQATILEMVHDLITREEIRLDDVEAELI